MNKKIFTKKRIIILVSAVFLIVVFSFFFFRIKNKNNQAVSDPFGIWETMVVLRSQTLSNDPTEDAKGALKRGDVLSIRPENHAWSETEYISYLLVKIEGKRSEVDKLLEPLEKETDQKDQEGKQLKETIRARKYAIDMSKLDFAGDQVINGQPLKDKVYGSEIVVEK